MFSKRQLQIMTGAGVVVVLALIGVTIRERWERRANRRLAPVPTNLAPERQREVTDQIAKSEAAIRANPSDFNAYVELALAKEELGDRDGAAETYRTMNQRFPGNYLSFQNLGQLYEDAGKYDLAAEQYLLAINNAPRIAHLYRKIVNLYTYQLKDRASDLPRILQKGLGVTPGSIDLMAMLAVYYRDHGQPEEAIKWYEHLLVFDPKNTAVLTEVKELQAQMRK
ncbi:tetratricopeptide repeat protein [Candidatus Uhrbacteria bacterium]|nr:tetratricopeptide repeat protein [Candidatus Uhrbacteria bacterium]